MLDAVRELNVWSSDKGSVLSVRLGSGVTARLRPGWFHRKIKFLMPAKLLSCSFVMLLLPWFPHLGGVSWPPACSHQRVGGWKISVRVRLRKLFRRSCFQQTRKVSFHPFTSCLESEAHPHILSVKVEKWRFSDDLLRELLRWGEPWSCQTSGRRPELSSPPPTPTGGFWWEYDQNLFHLTSDPLIFFLCVFSRKDLKYFQFLLLCSPLELLLFFLNYKNSFWVLLQLTGPQVWTLFWVWLVLWKRRNVWVLFKEQQFLSWRWGWMKKKTASYWLHPFILFGTLMM